MTSGKQAKSQNNALKERKKKTCQRRPLRESSLAVSRPCTDNKEKEGSRVGGTIGTIRTKSLGKKKKVTGLGETIGGAMAREIRK